MSKIESLINELCPNGIKYDTLSNLCKSLKKGTLKTTDLVADGEYPVINSGRDLYGYYSDYNNDGNAFTVAARGEYAGFISYFSSSFWAGGLCYPYASKDESIIKTKFIYYYLKSREKEIMNFMVSRGSIPALNKSDLDKLRIAVPPLEVQCEIVHILDDFTLLSAELSAELKARKKQYNAYLEILLDYKNFKDYNIMKMSELFDFRNGLSKGKEYFGKGTPFVRYTDVYNKRFLRKEDITQLVTCTDKELENLKVNRGDIFFTRTSEIAEEVGYSAVMLDEIENCVFNGFTIKATPKTNLLLPEYCSYCFSTSHFRNYVSTHCSFTTRASLTGKTIGEYEIAVPSIEEQKRIIKCLDKLYKLCNDISDGLPAEIEKRQKQYEYYRDKLLCFKELRADE